MASVVRLGNCRLAPDVIAWGRARGLHAWAILNSPAPARRQTPAKQKVQRCWHCGSRAHRSAHCDAYVVQGLWDHAPGNRLRHRPVLLSEVISELHVQDGLVLDGTFGAGGYTRELLRTTKASVLASDCDPEAFSIARQFESEAPGRVLPILSRFSGLKDQFTKLGLTGECLDGIMFDFGVSSMQLDCSERGFSFLVDGPLDMRMGGALDSSGHQSAADFLNTASHDTLADVIHRLGGEPLGTANAVAAEIVRQRAKRPLKTSRRLASIVTQAYRRLGVLQRQKRHVATRTFQAVRMQVNQELEEISAALRLSVDALRPGCRLCTTTFHKGEYDAVILTLRNMPQLELISEHKPSRAEVMDNPRSRSATLLVSRKRIS